MIPPLGIVDLRLTIDVGMPVRLFKYLGVICQSAISPWAFIDLAEMR
jgi:hypothetical protein